MRNNFRKAAMWILLGSAFLQTNAQAVESCFLASDSTDELILLVDRTDGTTAEVVGPFNVGLIEAMAKDPLDGTLFAANANQLGTVNLDTGAFTATASTFGVALATNGALPGPGNVTLSDVDAIAFDLNTGRLYGIQNNTGDEILFEINKTTGALVPGAFGGDDYVLVSGIGPPIDDIAIDSLGIMYASGGANLYSIPFVGVSGTVAASLVGPFGVGITDMEGLSTDLPGNIIGSTGASNTNGAFNNSVWTIDTGTGAASDQVPVAIGGDYEGFSCFLEEVDLDLEKSVVLSDDADATTTITPGDEVTYTITVTNNDVNLTAAGIEVTDNLNSLSGVSFVSFNTTKPNPGPPFPNPEYDSATGVWTVGSIPPNTSFDLNLVYTIDVGVAAGTSIFNTAEITQSANADPDSEVNNDDGDQSEDDENNASFVVGGVVGPASCPAGTSLVNQTGNADAVLVSSGAVQSPNNALGAISALGAAANAAGVSARLTGVNPGPLELDMMDSIPENATILISYAPDNGNSPGGLPPEITIETSVDGAVWVGALNLTFPVPPNANDILQRISYTVPSGFGPVRYIRLIRNRRANWFDGVEYSQICDAQDVADLTISKDDSSLTYTPGGTGSYVLTIANNGPDDVAGAEILDNLPNGVTLSALWNCAATAGSSCSAASGGVVGGSSVSLTADIVNGGVITVSVQVNFSSNMGDY